LGAAGCLILVASLPPADILAGLLVLAVGLAGRAVVLRRRRMSDGPAD
jgi:APA family basic amino acid/polyamine antiporter